MIVLKNPKGRLLNSDKIIILFKKSTLREEYQVDYRKIITALCTCCAAS